MVPIDQFEGFIWFDGGFIEWQKCKIHIATHALHYGGAVFEGIRIYNGKPFRLEEHNKRLINSAKLLGYKIPYNALELNEAVESAVKKQQLSSGYIRVIAWRGSQEQQISGKTCAIHVAIIAWNAFDERKKENLKLEIATWKKPPADCFPSQSKASGIYMMATLIQSEARSRGFDDALVLDTAGNVTEATTSNFFMVKNGVLYTSTADCFLDGITRQAVLKIAKDMQLESRVQRIRVENLKEADEAFLTGTTIEIASIGSIYDSRSNSSYNFLSRAITENIKERYSSITGKNMPN